MANKQEQHSKPAGQQLKTCNRKSINRKENTKPKNKK